MMKKNINLLLCFLLLAAIVSACNFSKGAGTKPGIGLSYSYNGFRVSDITLHDSSKDNPIKNKKIKYGHVLYVNIEGIKGFVVEEGRVYPGCEVTVTDLDGNIALQGSDLYPAEGYEIGDAATLYLMITMGDPVVAGKEYKTAAHIYDKRNPENVVDITIESEIVE